MMEDLLQVATVFAGTGLLVWSFAYAASYLLSLFFSVAGSDEER